MQSGVRKTFIVGVILLLGTPLAGTVLAFFQTPNSSSGSTKSMGQIISTVLVANFACIPFMFIGLILVLVAWAMHRNAGRAK